MKNIFNDYGNSLMLILIGIVAFVLTRNHESYSPQNTNFIDGILAEDPKEGVHDEDRDYIGVWIVGFDNFYEFSNCSHDDEIASTVKKLKKGDRISFYAKKNNSSTTYPINGKKYKTYRICDAISPDYGRIIEFEQYNYCDEFESKKLIPFLSGIMILIGIFGTIRKLKDKRNKNEMASLHTGFIRNKGENLELRPDRLTYVLRNSFFPFVSIGIGLAANYPFNTNDLDKVGVFIFAAGVYMLFHYIIIHDKIYYLIDSSGIRIKNVTFLFKTEMQIIRYNSIKEVIYRQAFYEFGKNIGTILIDNGDTNSDGKKVYSKLIGIENYKEIAKLILERADLKS